MESSARRSSARREPGAQVEAAAATLVTTLPDRRWFGAKGRTIARVTAVDDAAVPGTSGVLALFRVEFASREPEVYAFPLGEGAGRPADALDDPGFCTGLVEHMRAATTLQGRHGVFRFAATDALAAILPEPSTEVVHVTTEQSNTSVIVGGRVILKLFRRLEAGPNPEVEVTEFLTRETAFRGTPRLAGSIAYETPDGEPTTVATLQEFVPNQGDAWTAVQAHLDEYCSTIVNDATGAADAAFAHTLAAADAKEARTLGALTGQLHTALASAKAGSPLAPEPITPADLSTWLGAMHAQLDRSLVGSLRAPLDALPADARAVAQRVLDQAPRLRDALSALQALGTETITKLRVHGDYHLGQVLRTEQGFVIIDFEGEPTRPLAERRARQCALKDVAGMLRSFAYAARAAVLRAQETSPDDRTLEERLAPWVESWESGVRAAFLDGYLAETAERGAGFLPRRREVLEAVLRAYELDKAVYELAYEISHRPGWVRVPLDGLERAIAELPRVEVVQAHPAEGPFSFVACIELREFAGARAEDERQLAELIEQVPAASIYYHTHGFLLRHKFVAGVYPNDFATWAAVHVRDQVLGERLAMVDPVEFADMETLRQELVAVIDDHLRRLSIVPRVVSAEPFDFVQSTLVQIPTGVEVDTLDEFRRALLEVDASAIYFHLVEARTRLGRGDNDFARWLERRLGLGALAARFRALNPYTGSVERTRTRLIQLCDEALAQGGGAVSVARLDAYREVAPRGTIDLLERLGERLRGRRFLNVNASRFGGGSAEVLASLVPMMQGLGIDAGWEVIVGDPHFYAAVSRLEAGLAGTEQFVTDATLRAWGDTAAANAVTLSLEADVVMVYDVATLPLARHRPGRGRWVWRCTTDCSGAYRRLWYLVRKEVAACDAAVFSLPKFAQRLDVPTLIVNPSVDPLSAKNRELSRGEVERTLERLGVPRDKPILLQVAPYAGVKDPLGVVSAYRLAKKYVECRLVLAGWGAADNPEGRAILAELREAAERDPDLHPLVLPPDAALEINALQRAAAIVIHTPVHEDFGLAVAEAMWKGRPVIGSLAGGIPAQVIPDVTGYLVSSAEGAAFRIRQLLQEPDLMARLGGAAREYARRTFLITRHLGDYLALLASLTA